VSGPSPVFRPFTKADIPAVHAMVRRCEQHDAIPYATPVEEIEEIFDEPHYDPARQGLVAVDTDTGTDVGADRIVAWGRIWHQPSGERLERAVLMGYVDPYRRRQGIGTELLDRQVTTSREMLGRYDQGLPCYIRASSMDFLHDVHALYERAGMTAVRWSEELVRPVTPPPEVAGDPAITIVPWGEADEEAIRLVHNEAFSDHWGSSMLSPEAWHHELTLSAMRLDASFVALGSAEAGDRPIAGYLLSEHYPGDAEVTGRVEGWIGTLGTARAWRRRGVASSLIVRALAAYREAGFTHAMIGVDADNPSGAAGLYKSLGFETIQGMVTHEIAL
jgi:ribosomal protein S18 acetylase RimI-like enzyme